MYVEPNRATRLEKTKTIEPERLDKSRRLIGLGINKPVFVDMGTVHFVCLSGDIVSNMNSCVAVNLANLTPDEKFVFF